MRARLLLPVVLLGSAAPSVGWRDPVVGDVVRLPGGASAVVATPYDPWTGTYAVRGGWVAAEDLASHPFRAERVARAKAARRAEADGYDGAWMSDSDDDAPAEDAAKWRANCHFYDFPVPLVDLYEPVARRGDVYEFERRAHAFTCTLTYTPASLAACAYAYSDLDAVFELSNAAHARGVRAGHVVMLREDVHYGLRRYGYVERVERAKSGVELRVVHAVHEAAAWRLPRTVLATGPEGDAMAESAAEWEARGALMRTPTSSTNASMRSFLLRSVGLASTAREISARISLSSPSPNCSRYFATSMRM